MRLKHLKLAGFKSFVDPTVIPFTNSLSAVVGPNGCGKSNIIDAVRWVLGESSAKNLRGDDMSDVIFNGSNARKPVSVASVELLFDNVNGRAQGPWQKFTEISIKRQVSRQGQSDYFVNGQKCRRRDIADLLSGTGLGPRSYSIIEQGTISRLVESKPVELRSFIEDAAGISKYKERKRDTLNRIKSSRENLERLNDLHHELSSQIKSLESQAEQAQQYTSLKKQERQLQTDIVVHRWHSFNEQLTETKAALLVSKDALTRIDDGMISATVKDNQLVQQIKDTRVKLEGVNELYHEHQTSITTLSLNIEHLIQAQSQSQHLLEQLSLKCESLQTQQVQAKLDSQRHQLQMTEQQSALAPINAELDDVKAQLVDKEQQLEQVESKLFTLGNDKQQAQSQDQLLAQRKEALVSQQVKTSSQVELLNSKRVTLAQQQQRLNPVKRGESYQQAKHELLQLDNKFDDINAKAQSLTAFVKQTSDKINDCTQRIALNTQQRESVVKQIASKTASTDSALSDYFHQRKQLWQAIDVNEQWQLACDRLLGDDTAAYLMETIDHHAPNQQHAQLWPSVGEISVAGDSIVTHINANADVMNIVNAILGHVVCAADEQQALVRVKTIEPHQIIVTPQANIYTRYGFWRCGEHQQQGGLLQLQQQLQDVDALLLADKNELSQLLSLNETTQHELRAVNDQLVQLGDEQQRQSDLVNDVKQQWLLEQQQWEHIVASLDEVSTQVDELSESDKIDKQAIVKIEQSQVEMREQSAYCEGQLNALRNEKQLEKQQAKRLQNKLENLLSKTHQGELAVQKLQMQLTSEQQQLSVLEKNINELTNEQAQLKTKLLQDDEPLHHKQNELTQRQRAQNTLANDRATLNERLAALDQARIEQRDRLSHVTEQKAKQQKSIEQLTLKVETLKVKLQSQSQSIELSESEIAERAPSVANAPDAKVWPRELEAVRNSLSTMGAINLTAIEQYTEQKQRLDELTNQCDDLEQGLQTLEKAIKKIDRQSRDKFKLTFDSVNSDFQRLFPKVFGGGSAQLTLTDSDLLVAGVSIMAQPPGKKNSTIHLLSGGEKALTALSLVFAIFQLNPAPFCMLDEVDAPLDDANVDRYCNLVNEMSEKVQFIYITHNKVSMEMANQLTGVTMQEAGVSRIVAVDVDEAVSMAQQ